MTSAFLKLHMTSILTSSLFFFSETYEHIHMKVIIMLWDLLHASNLDFLDDIRAR